MQTIRTLHRLAILLILIALALAAPRSIVTAAPFPQTVPTIVIHTVQPPNPQPIYPTSTPAAGITRPTANTLPSQMAQSTSTNEPPGDQLPATPSVSAPLTVSAQPSQPPATDTSYIPQVSQGNLPAYLPAQPVSPQSGDVPGLAWWEILAAVFLVGGIIFLVTRQKKPV